MISATLVTPPEVAKVPAMTHSRPAAGTLTVNTSGCAFEAVSGVEGPPLAAHP